MKPLDKIGLAIAFLVLLLGIPVLCMLFALGWTRRGVSFTAQTLSSIGLHLSHPSIDVLDSKQFSARG